MRPIPWDSLIAAGIIIGLVLVIWAKLTKRTVPELIRDLRETWDAMRGED